MRALGLIEMMAPMHGTDGSDIVSTSTGVGRHSTKFDCFDYASNVGVLC